MIHFYAFTQTNLNIWTTTSDCPSKVDYRNESLAAEVVEAEECPLSKLCVILSRVIYDRVRNSKTILKLPEVEEQEIQKVGKKQVFKRFKRLRWFFKFSAVLAITYSTSYVNFLAFSFYVIAINQQKISVKLAGFCFSIFLLSLDINEIVFEPIH